MAKKKPAKKAAAKKSTAKRAATKKGARKTSTKTPRRAAAKSPKKKAAAKSPKKKAAAKSPRKAAAKPARKPAARKASRKPAARKAAPKASRAAPPMAMPEAPLRVAAREPSGPVVQMERPMVEVVETTSAGTQPLAPEHAAVDDLTSSGNELLDIFQKYDRNRTGYIEEAEFARLLEALGQNITDEELMIAFDIIDSERTGKISWKQFKNWWTSR